MSNNNRKIEFTDQNLRDALRRNGFPLEIRLLQTLEQERLDPIVGHRFVFGAGDSAEVDLVATLTSWLDFGSVTLKLLIEAKQFSDEEAFVGFNWRKPDEHTMRTNRLRLAGIPNCRVLDFADGRKEQEVVDMMLGGEDPIALALDPLNAPEVCVHWTEVMRRSADQLIAQQNQTHRDSFQKLVRVVTRLEEDLSMQLVEQFSRSSGLRLQFFLPVIAIAAPTLHLYDAIQDKLAPAPALVLDQAHEVGGRVHRRYVDVVTESALPSLIERCRDALDRLTKVCTRHAGALTDAAVRQSRLGEYEALAEANVKLNRQARPRAL